MLGLVIGFAARQTLANGIAGILLAITQPIRIGDLVTFEEESGVVEDMKLTYTYIRLDDGRRLIVPNERLAQSSVVNHTILDPRVQVEVSVWLPLDADLDKAMELIRDEDDGRRGICGRGGQGGRAAQRARPGLRVPPSAARPPPSCGSAGFAACGSTHYPQPRPERGSPPNVDDTSSAKVEEAKAPHAGAARCCSDSPSSPR